MANQDYQPYATNRVFKKVQEQGEPLDLFKPDEIEAPTLEGVQNMLSDMGVLVPPADFVNAAIYLHQKEYGMMALSATSVIPFIGEIKKGWNYLKNSGKYVTLYRGVKGVDNVDELFDPAGKKLVGNWKQSSYGKNPKTMKVIDE